MNLSQTTIPTTQSNTFINGTMPCELMGIVGLSSQSKLNAKKEKFKTCLLQMGASG
jgi:hypothetical protein